MALQRAVSVFVRGGAGVRNGNGEVRGRRTPRLGWGWGVGGGRRESHLVCIGNKANAANAEVGCSSASGQLPSSCHSQATSRDAWRAPRQLGSGGAARPGRGLQRGSCLVAACRGGQGAQGRGLLGGLCDNCSGHRYCCCCSHCLLGSLLPLSPAPLSALVSICCLPPSPCRAPGSRQPTPTLPQPARARCPRPTCKRLSEPGRR